MRPLTIKYTLIPRLDFIQILLQVMFSFFRTPILLANRNSFFNQSSFLPPLTIENTTVKTNTNARNPKGPDVPPIEGPKKRGDGPKNDGPYIPP